MYFVLSLVVSREVSSDAQTESSSVLIVALTALALVLIIISFAVKRRFLVQSVDRQDITLVQRGYLFAWVFCEVTALVGLLLGLRIGYRQYYVLFLLAGVGIALHFPRREHLLAASYKTTNQTSF